jgi:hypothetical protein
VARPLAVGMPRSLSNRGDACQRRYAGHLVSLSGSAGGQTSQPESEHFSFGVGARVPLRRDDLDFVVFFFAGRRLRCGALRWEAVAGDLEVSRKQAGRPAGRPLIAAGWIESGVVFFLSVEILLRRALCHLHKVLFGDVAHCSDGI